MYYEAIKDVGLIKAKRFIGGVSFIEVIKATFLLAFQKAVTCSPT